MRSFSKDEESYLVAIVKAYKSGLDRMVLKNLVFSIFKRSINIELPGFELKKEESDDKTLTSKYENAIKRGYIPISNFFSLLIYLQSNHLIMIVPYFESEDFALEFVGDKNDESTGYWFGISTSSYLAFLKSNYSNFIYPTQELIDLVENDFKSIEQRRFETELDTAQRHHVIAIKKAQKQICIAWCAFGVALLTLILTICFNYFGAVKVKYPKIEKQLNQIKQVIIKQKQSEVLKNEITNDTIKVKIVDMQENRK